MLTITIHKKALQAANEAASAYIENAGEGFPCGFAWVRANVKGNTKLGKSFIALGFSKAYGGGFQLWNPSQLGTQDMNAKAAGARAYARVVCDELGLADIVSAECRMD